MKRFAFVFFFFLFLLLSVSVSAHPGRTDEDGGHYDQSTGKYHWHHGYEAHQHYDMDSDGDIDCPYNFKDKTNHTGGSKKTPEPSRVGEIESKKGGWFVAVVAFIAVVSTATAIVLAYVLWKKSKNCR